MLETREERARLLRAGLTGKTIERLYVTFNDIKIKKSPILFEFDKYEYNNDKKYAG